MTLRIRQLRLRASTASGPYGADVAFGTGLTVIWADNTKGKSTCMQAMLYALGLEKMLSPRREIPLPHAMTTYLRTDSGAAIDILESSVALEIENAAGTVITIRRGVKSESDTRLVTVEFGPTLSNPGIQVSRRNFFVLDPGAATREDGFHAYLEDFIGWKLPMVRRYDLPETKLYLETIVPLFWVEQKSGWSSIPAAIPTYFRIREVHKRAVEFLLGLDVYQLELQRQQLEEQLAANARAWRLLWDEVDSYARRRGARTAGVPDRPTADTESFAGAHVVVAVEAKWVPLLEHASTLREQVTTAESEEVPQVEAAAGPLREELEALTDRLNELNLGRISEFNRRQLKAADVSSLERRIVSLEHDLQKNQDVQKLQRYAGESADLSPERCPTCEQSLSDTLMSQTIIKAVMPIEENIEYIRSQLRMFRDIFEREKRELELVDVTIAALDRDLSDVFGRVRVVRNDLISPSSTPSAAAIEQRVRTEGRVRELEELQSEFENGLEKLEALSEAYGRLLNLRARLPDDKMSGSDRRKLSKLTDTLIDQARAYGFSTFDPSELSISEDSYRPQKEGFEIGFEISASDAIRLKWAYQLGLLELAASEETNHPNLLLFDEPRQQETAKVSFSRLLERASRAKSRSQQMIFSTSEDLPTLQGILSGIDCASHIFEGYIIQPLDS